MAAIAEIVKSIEKKGYNKPQEIYKKFRKVPLERFYVQKWSAPDQTPVIIKVCLKDDKEVTQRLIRERDNLKMLSGYNAKSFKMRELKTMIKFQQYYDFFEDDQYVYLVSVFADNRKETYKELSCKNKVEILLKIIEYFQGFNKVEKLASWYDILTEHTLSKLNDLGVLSNNSCESLLSLKKNLAPEEMSISNRVLVHSDLMGLNLRIDSGRDCDLHITVIDLEGLRQGPPLFEYASTCFFGMLTKRFDLRKYKNFDEIIDQGWFQCITEYMGVFKESGISLVSDPKIGNELFRLNILRNCISRLNYYADLVYSGKSKFGFYQEALGITVRIIKENLG